ncbi:ADP-ribosylation factor K-like [Bolinopsis microptera]|uniref:ADP-ribosylation factor K-like n=1 Tax=Bolinopsis microptera TaxID=2820187 RepID=UPI003079BB53
MGIYLSTFVGHISRLFSSDKAASIIIVGLANAGKSSLVRILKDEDGEEVLTAPTIGHVVETINYKNIVNLHIWDLGGQDKLRILWQRYFLTAEAVIFVVDSSETDRFTEALGELEAVLKAEELRIVPILVLANKQDMVTVGTQDLVEMFDLSHISDRPFKVFKCSIKNNEGIEEAMKWLLRSL